MKKSNQRTSPIAQQRMGYIDAAKGLAIVLVVMGHLLHADGDMISPEVDKIVGNVIYSFHMPLFFFITGYCRFLSEQRAAMDGTALLSEIGKLSRRLLPCYLLWTLIYFLVRMMTDPADPLTWLTITLTFRGVAPLWFLADLYLAELVFLPLLCAARGRWQIHGLAALVTGALTIPICQMMWNANQAAKELAQAVQEIAPTVEPVEEVYNPAEHIVPYLEISLGRVVPTLFFLLCGYLAAKVLYQRRIPSIVYLLLGCAGIAAAVFAQINLGNTLNLHLCLIKNPGLFLFTGLTGSLGSVLLCKGLCRLLPMLLLRALGRNSLGIMVLHYTPIPTLELASSLSLLMVPHIQLMPVAYLLLVTALAVGMCCLVTYLIKQRLFL